MRFMIPLALAALFLSAAGAAPVNVNTASADEIAAALNGVGAAKAAAIVEHRDRNGRFRSAEELSAVSGIGEKLLERIRADVRLDDAGAGAATR